MRIGGINEDHVQCRVARILFCIRCQHLHVVFVQLIRVDDNRNALDDLIADVGKSVDMTDAKLVLALLEAMLLDGSAYEHRAIYTQESPPLYPIIAEEGNFASAAEVFDSSHAIRLAVLCCTGTNGSHDATQSDVLSGKGSEVVHLSHLQVADILQNDVILVERMC